MSQQQGPILLFTQFSQWRKQQMESQIAGLSLSLNTIFSFVLCFIAASISSAGGVGGGSLFLPILNLLAGLDLKTATAFSAFMVTGGSLSNVIYNLFFRAHNTRTLVDYEIALLSEPCMLLGVSVGVVCNLMFPEWLITMLFALFLACSTFKTCSAGCKCWMSESGELSRNESTRLEGGVVRDVRDGDGEGKEPLLVGEAEDGLGFPWKKMVVLVMVWFSFFVLHLIIGDKDGKSMIHIRPCGVGYWVITLSQVPLAFGFTAYILYETRRSQYQKPAEQKDINDIAMCSKKNTLPIVVFPIAALLSGILGGLFGIGGGLLINPVLLHIGIHPQTTAATTTFMVLFSSSMSSVQYLILGMKGVKQALAFTVVCFLASIVGMIIIQKVIEKSGRASLIIFLVGTVMALSMISITCFGAMDVWSEYKKGNKMGFKVPC